MTDVGGRRPPHGPAVLPSMACVRMKSTVLPARKFRPSPSASSRAPSAGGKGRSAPPSRTGNAPLLDVLTHGVQVRRELHAGGEETLVLLALGLAEQLLPPLGHEPEAGSKAASTSIFLPVRYSSYRAAGILPGRFFCHVRLGADLHHTRHPPSSWQISTPATAMGSRPTAVRTLYRPPMSSGTTKLS